MLQITPDAATFLSELRRGHDMPDTYGLRVFVAPELAEPLDDAEIDVAGEGGTPRIVFRPQGALAS